MNDYMQALHRRFFKEPKLKELREKIEDLRLSLKAEMSRDNREQLLKLIDLGIELRDEISLASFRAGFQLALGIVSELDSYSFDEDEEQRALEKTVYNNLKGNTAVSPGMNCPDS